MSGVYGGSGGGGSPSSDANSRAAKRRQKTSISGTGETLIVTAGPAGTFNDLYGIIVANTGAAATKVDFRDSSGGTIMITLEVPANDTRGFMLPAPSSTDQTSSAAAWTAQAQSVTNLEITALYVANTP